MKFRTELWRIIKFILITGVVNLPLTIAYGAIVNGLAAAGQPGMGNWLVTLNYANSLLSTTLLTLLHRYFTFRATEKWYIALPFMLVAVIAWQLLKTYPMAIAAKQSHDAAVFMSNLLAIIWPILQYLLQRCVIYCHTTDQNGWYRRFHPDTDDEGV